MTLLYRAQRKLFMNWLTSTWRHRVEDKKKEGSEGIRDCGRMEHQEP